ncbi:MAG: hypothetical protein CL453_01935 [Acidimicrobiaceae bacterium]|nr:hypothetical protein [Acidimicrobiaceae bacterium]
MKVHETAIKVRFNELDSYGHVNHSNYLHYFEEARISAMAKAGKSIDQLFNEGYLLVVAQIETRFLAPAFLSDNLLIQSGIAQTRRASAQWIQRITKDESVIAIQNTRVGCTTTKGKPCKFPAELSHVIKELIITKELAD